MDQAQALPMNSMLKRVVHATFSLCQLLRVHLRRRCDCGSLACKFAVDHKTSCLLANAPSMPARIKKQKTQTKLTAAA